ncbi:MAG TPA: cytochrome c peroxidase, partial [Methylocystis sp.]
MGRVANVRKSIETTLVALPLAALLAAGGWAMAEPLGLPKVPVPADNPQSPEKVALGDKLFHDARFSIDGTVSCSTCHNDKKA